MKKILILSIAILIIIGIGIGIFILINKEEKNSTTTNNDISNNSNTNNDENKQQESLTLEEVLAAPETDSSQFDWRSTENGVYLRSCSSKDDIIVIPEEVDGQPVLGIDANGLSYLNCRAIVLPDSATYIENASIGMLEHLEILVYGSGIEDEQSMPTGNLPTLKILAVKEGAKKVPAIMAFGAHDLEKVYLPASLEADFLSTVDLIFDSGNPTFIVEPGSAAEEYAKTNGFKYEYK